METIQCGSCGEVKPIEDFNFRSSLTGKRHTTCKACQKIFKRNFYLKNRADYIKKSARQKKEAIERNRRLVLEYLETHPCVDCGESDITVLEFDHLKDKDRTIAQLVIDGVSWVKILKEIEKCEVRCANCHRKKTARQLDWYKSFLGP